MSKAQQFIEERLVPPLLHGDEAHQQWLREELRKWIPDLERVFDDYEKTVNAALSLRDRDVDPTRIFG